MFIISGFTLVISCMINCAPIILDTMAYSFSLRCTVIAIALIYVPSHGAIFQEPIRQGNFSYFNCNTSAVPLLVNSLQVNPDPVRFGEWIYAEFDVTLDKDAGSNGNSIEVDLSLRLETRKGNISLCQIIGESLCHYNDFCDILRKFMDGRKCPRYVRERYHNNCSCPIQKQSYSTQGPILIPLSPLSFELRGTFDLTIRVHEEGKMFGCFEIHFCITDCKPLGY